MNPTLLARQRVICGLGELAQVLAVHDHLAARSPGRARRSGSRAWSCPSPRDPSAPGTRPSSTETSRFDQNGNAELVASVFLVNTAQARSRTFRPWTMNLSRSVPALDYWSIRTISNSRSVFIGLKNDRVVQFESRLDPRPVVGRRYHLDPILAQSVVFADDPDEVVPVFLEDGRFGDEQIRAARVRVS